MSQGRRLQVEGTVQGVGFRPWVHRTATELGLRGTVINTPRGVVIEAWGTVASLDALLVALRESIPPAARVRRVAWEPLPPSPVQGFTIGPSEQEGARLLTVPADLGACEDCLSEVDDPGDRHHAYAFTSCTSCGPRFSVVESLPYDRARTTMDPFPLCEACRAEYTDLGDRRFHAQAIACPRCGPRLWLADPTGRPLDEGEPLQAAAVRILRGEVLGLHGLGGFHLACDATREDVVATLRSRKRRDGKPLAVMVRDLAMARSLADLDDDARAALLSPARPIVLAPPAHPGGGLAPGVTGPSSRVGLVLPYTPMQHLLLERCDRPLVMTSGNLSGEPIAVTHEEALSALGGVVDAFLLHDRRIVRRVEDSVVAAWSGATRLVRRARGYAPDAIPLPLSAPEPVLAVGGHLKNTACLVVGDKAYVTPHLGDLETWEAEEAFRADVEGFERLLGVRAERLVHDLHPEYGSTRYAQERPARARLGVQHHVAHVLAAAAEYGLQEPLVGVVFDGTGWGPDGTAWGAEVLRVDGLSWSRLASYRPLPLPGGERAIKEVWRIAYGALHEAFGDEAGEVARRLEVFRELPRASLDTVGRMLASGVGTVAARGMGRWFDAVGALVLGLSRASFEGHVALALEERADGGEAAPYPWGMGSLGGVEGGSGDEVDLRPVVRAVVRDHLDGASAGRISARFHRTVVEASAGLARGALARGEAARVVLSGGSFQNRILAGALTDALGASKVVMARELPVNDGGISLGQAWAGVLAARSEMVG